MHYQLLCKRHSVRIVAMDVLTLVAVFLFTPVIILLIYDYYIHQCRRGKFVDKIPGPKFYPIIGNGLDLNVPAEQMWRFFRNSARDYYPVFKVWIFNRPLINIRHPDDIEILLSSNKLIEKSRFYDFLHPWLNEGLLTSTGDKWRGRRKILTPAFHFNVLEEFVDTFVEHTDKLVEGLSSEVEAGHAIRELLPMFSKVTLGTICETAMGTTLDGSDRAQSDYRKSIYDIGNMFYWRAMRPWLKHDAVFSLTSIGRAQAKLIKRLHGFTTAIIEERKQYHDSTGGKHLHEFSGGDEKTDADMTKNRRRLAFLDLLIAASRKGIGVDDRGIREEVDTFVFEGHDTTAVALSFFAMLLAERQDIQNRCRQEVQEVMRESVNGKMNIRDVQKFNYLERCIKESLRLYPSVPAVGRKATEDIQLKTCFIPEGAVFNIFICDTHRDPNYWPRPNIYDPDRFLPENTKGRHPFAYVPFSAGPRNCIGQKFAMLELKTIMAGLLLRFQLEPMELAADVRLVTDLVLRTSHPVFIKVVPISK